LPTTKIVVPSGHLGTTPFELESFQRGCEQGPDFIIADSGSADIGPMPLGADRPPSDPRWQEHDLEAMLLAARRLDVPMIVGSASDTGTDAAVDRFIGLIRGIAKRHSLPPFKLTAIYSELSVEAVRKYLAGGRVLEGLDGRDRATDEDLAATDRIVAVMGAEPIAAALADGAQVVICGRASDPSIFAAPLLNAGHTPANAFFAGKALECASFCAEPFMGKETVLGVISDAGVDVSAMNSKQRCTPTSVAAHTMYERVNPFREYVPGGYVDLTACQYEQIDPITTRVTGQRFVRDDVYRTKLEGSGKVAERRLFIAGIRDPYIINLIDQVIDLAKERLRKRFGPIGEGYDVHYHLYGRNAVMGDLDPSPAQAPHELGVVVDVMCTDAELAEQICHIAAKALFMTRLPEIKGTAGTAAIFLDEVLTAQPVYRWTLNHVMEVDDPHELFRTVAHTIAS